MNNEKVIKKRVLNLIILDKSGSMKEMRNAIVDELNEYFCGIHLLQQKNELTQEHFVTLIMFGGKRVTIVYDEVPIKELQPFSSSSYKPYGMTCLYDAVGLALCRTEIHISKSENTVVIVSIVSDGTDNSSEDYSPERLRSIIHDLCKKGWKFFLISNNEDARRTALDIGINHVCSFSHEEQDIESIARYIDQFI